MPLYTWRLEWHILEKILPKLVLLLRLVFQGREITEEDLTLFFASSCVVLACLCPVSTASNIQGMRTKGQSENVGVLGTRVTKPAFNNGKEDIVVISDSSTT